jgi:HEAT repeat protein
MNPKLLLKVFPVVLLTVVQVVGMGGVARSQAAIQQSANQRQEIDRLIQQLKSGDSQVRLSAIYALGSVGFSEKPVIPFLIPILNDRDPDVRSRAAISVARILASARLDVFSVEQFPTDVPSAQKVFQQELFSMFAESARPAIPTFIALLKDRDENVRSLAASALGNIGASAKSGIPDLIPLLKDQDRDVRFNAAEALGEMGASAKSAIPDLILLLKDEDMGLRVVVALGKIREKS